MGLEDVHDPLELQRFGGGQRLLLQFYGPFEVAVLFNCTAIATEQLNFLVLRCM